MQATVVAELSSVEFHLQRVRECEHAWEGHPLPTATPKGGRYPLVYPRDTAIITRALDRLARLGAAPDAHAEGALRGAAEFLLSVQDGDGFWVQRYDTEGNDRSIYPQEDNTAHAVATLARHLRRERGAGDPSPLEDRAVEAMAKGLDAAESRHLDEGVGLFRSTTSVHESALERGYTLWVNGAYAAAYRLAADAARAAGRGRAADAWRGAERRLVASIAQNLIHEDRFVRRLTPEGAPDLRPDVTLLSPFYFGFAGVDPHAEARAVGWMERGLWARRLGLICRYPADPDDPGVHMHGGHGPYLSFSCWLAQRHAQRGERDRAGAILSRVARFATRDGALPEHVAAAEAFQEFMDGEWRSGRDLRKELDPDIIRDGVGHGPMLREVARMTDAYEQGVREAERAGDGIVRVAAPHAWTHADFALALAMADAADGRDGAVA